MRLILKDYLLQLREKDELDLLLCDVLLQMGYTTDNKPETGNRQYGVDIRAHTDKEVLLCIVKQGNFTRKMWNTDQNAVRQSLEEIQDCYLKMICGEDRKKRLRIVVATNGVLDEAMRPNWEWYVERNTEWDSMPVKIELWNIDSIVDSVQKYLFDEHIFDAELQSMLRHALYFMGEDTYNQLYYEKIISHFLDGLNEDDNSRQRKKKLAGLHLASQMIAQYAANAQIFKIAINVSEYLLLQYWNYMRRYNLLGNTQAVSWLNMFISDYYRWSECYYEKVRICCERKNALPAYNPVAQRVLVYEVLGYLVSYAYSLSFRHDHEAQVRCSNVVNSIIELINNHPQYYYPVYDCNICIINMLCRLLLRQGLREHVHELINGQCTYLMGSYRLSKSYPAATDSFEDAVNIYMRFPTEPYETSALWGNLLLWIALLKEEELYESVKSFLTEELSEVTTCTWFLRAVDEDAMYKPHTVYLAGEGMAVDVCQNFEEFQSNNNFLLEQYKGEFFSFDEYSFPALEFIADRYWGTLPRIRMEEKCNL